MPRFASLPRATGLATLAAVFVLTGCGSTESGSGSSASSPAQILSAHNTSPSTSASRQKALASAKGYLKSDMEFSRAGLISQLTDSLPGDGFSVADATYGVDHTHANWDQEAVKAAKGYLSMQRMSKAALIKQLTAPDADQFTQAQARYAVSKAY